MFTCLELNISACSISEDETMFLIAVYNPLSRPVSTPIRFPVEGNYSYAVQSLNDGMYAKIFRKYTGYLGMRIDERREKLNKKSPLAFCNFLKNIYEKIN